MVYLTGVEVCGINTPDSKKITFLSLKKRLSTCCTKFKLEQDYAIIFPRGD